MSYKDGLCFPSYETIAEKARSTFDLFAIVKRIVDAGGQPHRPRRTNERDALPYPTPADAEALAPVADK